MPVIPEVNYPPAAFETLLATPEVRVRIEAAAARQGVAPADAHARARDYARGIAANFSFPVARAGDRFLNWVFRRVFAGIEVRNLEAVRQLAPNASIVYLPCHRSHLDYLLLSHVIFHGGLTPPHIAAGDNMNMPLLGGLLRLGGGFFMRRSFKGDPLYATVFAVYLQGLLARGLPIEFFIEGGRSRTGRMLPPKTGLLGMVLEAFVRQPERPLVLVPVYIGYEKLPEGRSFLNEMAGRPKRSESLWDLVVSLRVLRQRFGSPCVSIGKPLPVADWLDGRLPDWRHAGGSGYSSLRPDVAELAEEASRRINAAALVMPVNLVALALLVSPGASTSVTELTERIARLQEQSADKLSFRLTPAECIAHAVALGVVNAHGEEVSAPDEKAALLEYFRNNVVHHFPALNTD